MRNSWYFIILNFFLIIIAFFSNKLLNTHDLIYYNLSEQFAKNQVEEILEYKKKWQWLGYIFIPFIQLIKISLISSVLYIGIFFYDIKLTFNKLFLIVVKAEYLFILVGLIKLLWFAFQDDYSLEDIQYFYPLSALNIVGYDGLSPWFLYPFQILNLFELAYWFLLAYFVSKEINSSLDKAFTIVSCSYGPALLTWVVFIMFFTLNAS